MHSRFRLAALTACLGLALATPALAQVPAITSLQSVAPTFGDVVVLPVIHGNAITSGLGLSYFVLIINGNFGSVGSVQWTDTSTGVTTNCFIDTSGCSIGSVSSTRITVNVPGSLFNTPVPSQVTIHVTVTEPVVFTNLGPPPAVSNIANFFLNPPLTLVSLPAAPRGAPYSKPFVTGGTPPYDVTIFDPLPPGMSVPNTDPTISGTPTVSGFYSFTFDIADTWGALLIEESAFLEVYDPPVISSLSPPARTVGGGNFVLTVTGSYFMPNCTFCDGPAGSQIYFGGTPLITTFVNSTTLQATILNSQILLLGNVPVFVRNWPNRDSNTVNFVVVPPLQILTTALPPATASQPYTTQLTGTGGLGPYLWSATGLPGGFQLNPNTGLIFGTNQQGGSFTVVVTLRDSIGGIAVAQFPLVVIVPVPPLNIGGSLPNGQIKASYSGSVFGTGGIPPYSFSVSGGALPDGLTLQSDGVVSGTPTKIGTFRFVIRVNDSSNGSAVRDFVVQILPEPLAVTGTVSDVTLGAAINVQFGATGGVPAYTFGVSGSIPPGTRFSSGALSGTTTSIGTFQFTVVVTDSTGATATRSFTIKVTVPPLQLTGTAGNGQVGVVYSAVFGGTGGVPAYTFTATGLPPGLRLEGSSIIGTPSADGTFQVVVTLTDSAGGRATGTFTVVILPPALQITTASLPNGTVGVSYGATFNATGGVPPYTWSIAGAPDGLTPTPSNTGLAGTPTRAGTFTVVVTVTDSKGATATRSFTVVIAAPPLQITTLNLLSATVGVNYTAILSASGGVPPYTWTIAGLPAGMSLSGAGIFSGAATAPGTANLTVTVRDSSGDAASRNYNLSILLPATPPVNVTGLPATANPGTQNQFQIALGSTYPGPVNITLTLTFAPDFGADDPAVQFQTGGRTAQVTIPAGSTTTPNIGIQSGTVAGTVTITYRLTAFNSDVTPTPVPSRTIRINATPPVISSVSATRNATGFTVTVSGFASSREITQVLLTFTGASGANLQTTQLTIAVDTLFAQWWTGSASAPFGSQFTLTLPFTVQGNTQAIASLSVTLASRAGNSNAVSANLQ